MSATTTTTPRAFNRPSEKHALASFPLFRAVVCDCGFPLVRDVAGKPFCAACDERDAILSTPWASFRPECLDDGTGVALRSFTSGGAS